MQARYYDPEIGRFYSNDPLGFRGVHSFNRYAYGNNKPYKYIDPDGRDPSDAFKPLSDFFKNTEKQARQLPNDLKATSKVVGDGLVEGGRIAGEATAESLGTASTVTGLIPGGQIVSIALAGADLLVNGTSASLASASSGAIIDKTTTDLATNFGKVKPTNTVTRLIYGISQAVSYMAGEAQSDVEKQNELEEKNEVQN